MVWFGVCTFVCVCVFFVVCFVLVWGGFFLLSCFFGFFEWLGELFRCFGWVLVFWLVGFIFVWVVCYIFYVFHACLD